MNAVGTDWVTPGLPRMSHECSGYGMGHAWVTEDVIQAACGMPLMMFSCTNKDFKVLY